MLERVRRITEGNALMKVILETGELPDLDLGRSSCPVRDRARRRLRQDVDRQDDRVGHPACR